MIARSTLARLFLLIALAFGVASMHTLGHQGLSGHDPAMTAGHATATWMSMDGQASAENRTAPTMGMNPFAVCLAILGLTVLIVMMLLRRPVRRAVTTIGRLLVTLAACGRGPPTPVQIGLRLADLSVMRI